MENIRVLAFAIDGVLTDGKITIASSDTFKEFQTIKTYSYKDIGCISALMENGLKVVGMSSIYNKGLNVSYNECDNCLKLSQLLHGEKKDALERYLNACDLGWENLAYIGNYDDDYDCLQLASWSVCSKESSVIIKRVSQFISQITAGNGMISDVYQSLLKLG